MATSVFYHDGEAAVQGRAGVPRPGGIARSIRAEIPAGAGAFLREQPFAIIGAASAGGPVWASILAGGQGFLNVHDARTVHVAAGLAAGDALQPHLDDGTSAGLLVIDLATRQRMRLNGRIAHHTPQAFDLRIEQVFGNCQKYIQARVLAQDAATATPTAGTVETGRELTAEQQRRIAAADTFFIASAHPSGGADVSHRGGLPGFISMTGADRLAFPDYTGNFMFQTLGNMTVDPRCGLLFIDFEHGHTLQITGRAAVDWSPTRAATFPGAARVVDFQVEAVVERSNVLPLRWRLLDYSPFNPS